MNEIPIKYITEDVHVYYTDDAQLSYIDEDDDYISLYVDKIYEGECYVWRDSEMEGREYIIINNIIYYLDTLKEY